MMEVIRYCKPMGVNTRVIGVILRLPCRTIKTAKRNKDARMAGAVWNKDARAWVVSIKPDCRRQNHLSRPLGTGFALRDHSNDNNPNGAKETNFPAH